LSAEYWWDGRSATGHFIDETSFLLDDTGHINATVRCLHCDYNLRGLEAGGRCPECGRNVDASLRYDLLRYADPRWLRTVRDGFEWLITFIVLVWAWPFLAAFPGRVWPPSNAFRWLLATAPIAIGFMGMWKVSTPEPGLRSPPARLNARVLTRVAAVLAITVAAAQFGVLLLDIDVIPLALYIALLDLAGLLGVAATMAGLSCVGGLAERMPETRLARSTRRASIGFAALLCLGVLLLLLTPIAFSIRSELIGLLAAICGAAILVAGPALWTWLLVLLVQYRRRMAAALAMRRLPGRPTAGSMLAPQDGVAARYMPAWTRTDPPSTPAKAG
jgi:hypothetical protein